MPLADAMMSGVDAIMLDRRRACRCARRRTAPRRTPASGRARRRRRAARTGIRALAGRMPPSPWIGSTRKPAVFSSIAASAASRSLNSTTVKPGSSGAKPSRIFAWSVALIVAIVRPWKALEKVIRSCFCGLPLAIMVAARGLDRAFDRLGARIGEEHRVGEGQVDQPLRERLALRRAVEVRDVHQRRRLLLDRLGQMRDGRGRAG